MSLSDLLTQAQGKPTTSTKVPVVSSSNGGLSKLLSTAQKPTAIDTKITPYKAEDEVLAEKSKQLNSFGGIVKGTLNNIADIGKNFGNNLYNTWKDTPGKIANDVSEASKDISKGSVTNFVGVNNGLGIPGVGGSTGKGIVKAGFRVAADSANAIFAPFSAAISAILQGSGGQALVDKAGNTIADKSGITDWPAFQKFAMEHPNAGEDFNRFLTLGLSANEKGTIDPARMATESKALATKLISQAKSVEAPKPPTSGLQKLVEEAKPTEIAKVEVKSNPIIKPIEGTGAIKKSGLATGVEAKAIEANLTKTLGDLPEYKTVSMKDQALKATDILDKDYEQAKRIATGQEAPVGDVLPESVYVAVENRALREGDIETIRQLATNSSLTSEATTMGQRIRTLAERNPESPVRSIREVKLAREKNATKGNKTVRQAKDIVIKDIKNEIKKTSPTKQTWTQFINDIKC